MAGFAVNVFQQGEQFLAELIVIAGAAQPAGIAEFDELYTANGAFALIERTGLLTFLTQSPTLGTRAGLQRLGQKKLVVALLAEV